MRETEVLFLEEVRPLQALAAGCGTAGAARQALCAGRVRSWAGAGLGWPSTLQQPLAHRVCEKAPRLCVPR